MHTESRETERDSAREKLKQCRATASAFLEQKMAILRKRYKNLGEQMPTLCKNTEIKGSKDKNQVFMNKKVSILLKFMCTIY